MKTGRDQTQGFILILEFLRKLRRLLNYFHERRLWETKVKCMWCHLQKSPEVKSWHTQRLQVTKVGCGEGVGGCVCVGGGGPRLLQGKRFLQQWFIGDHLKTTTKNSKRGHFKTTFMFHPHHLPPFPLSLSIFSKLSNRCCYKSEGRVFFQISRPRVTWAVKGPGLRRERDVSAHKSQGMESFTGDSDPSPAPFIYQWEATLFFSFL